MVKVMRDDPVTRQVLKDDLILYVAHIYKCRIKIADCDSHIRQRLRLLARVVVLMKLPMLKDVLLPAQFHNLCDIVSQNFLASAQLKLGVYIKNAMDSLYNLAIQSDKNSLKKAIKSSLHLMKTEWKHRVGHQALMETEQQRFNTIDILPISRDVLKMRNYLDDEVMKCVRAYTEGSAVSIRAKKVLACKTTLFNKRRGMEFVKSSKEEIIAAIKATEENPRHQVSELELNLTPIEQALSSKMHLLTVRGKQGKGVSVLLEPADWQLLQCILKDPNCQKDTYVFQNSKKKPLRGHIMMAELVKVLDLEKPDAMRATALRKYLATVIQVMALPKYQKNWVAEHLGHTMAVHGKHYRYSYKKI